MKFGRRRGYAQRRFGRLRSHSHHRRSGSGKTKTLAHRVAHLVVAGVDPRRILLLTFSRPAAAEMARRAERIVASVAGSNAAVASPALTRSGTFHGIGARLLREYAEQITCLDMYSRCVNSEAPLGEVLAAAFPWCARWEAELRNLFAGYVEAKQRQNVLDYDDLLLYWAQMMLEPALAADVAARFDHVLVDEYQDTNRIQAKILLAMKPELRESRHPL